MQYLHDIDSYDNSRVFECGILFPTGGIQFYSAFSVPHIEHPFSSWDQVRKRGKRRRRILKYVNRGTRQFPFLMSRLT